MTCQMLTSSIRGNKARRGDRVIGQIQFDVYNEKSLILGKLKCI